VSPCCTVHSACSCCLSMLGVQLYISPCCMSMLHAHASWPCFHSTCLWRRSKHDQAIGLFLIWRVLRI
jgi:hypothetical protein